MDKNQKIIHLIAAARPNFMKIAPLYHELKIRPWADPRIIHTGQHYDHNMSDAFFLDLDMPQPHIHLGVGGGSHAEQTGKVMMAYERVVLEQRPDLVVVVGDVNATLACSLAVTKVTLEPPLEIKGEKWRRPVLAHLEAGLRSFDLEMPEEINRMVTDTLADVLWTPSADGDMHLRREGVADDRIVRVGNIMIDSFEMMRERIMSEAVVDALGLEPGKYGVATLHRPSNVDSAGVLSGLCDVLQRVSKDYKIVFPIHPRTRQRLLDFGLMVALERNPSICLLEPQNYIRFMGLVANSRFVLTDSGGIQEETTYLGIPCLTLRENTERPITISEGTNQLCNADNVEDKLNQVLSASFSEPRLLELWDGRTACRVADSIANLLF
ncbi:MAG: UDP-N-acetylglucosamine 2-epimerase (non-hydrolyzing) [Gammaproteobacteria bacterium]|nr:UDP-N-acetylglucosamine 2-epimerase (non-hydrolyzing) [Gammaproteobacteria bacterium]